MLHDWLDILTGFFMWGTDRACSLADIEIGWSFAATNAIGTLALIASLLFTLLCLGGDE